MRFHESVFVSIVVAFVGCGGKANDAPVPPAPSGPVTEPAASYAATAAASALAHCSDPHGSIDAYDSVGALSTKLVGAWLRCPAERPSQYDHRGDENVGIALTSTGAMRILGRAADGSIVQGHGLDAEATYAIHPPETAEYNNISYFIVAKYANGGSGGFYAKFEAGPRKLRADMGVQPDWFVPLDP